MNHKIKIAPSVLAADFTKLKDEVRRVEDGGCDLLHLDVMDGHFVPNISFGPMVVEAVRRVTKLRLDVQLMIENPWRYIDAFAKAGTHTLVVHEEACKDKLLQCLADIKKAGCHPGVSIKPETPLDAIRDVLPVVDQVLIMSVNPGFGGQAFMPEVLPKMEQLRKIYDKDICVDGGVNMETCGSIVKAGANILVAGTAIFSQHDAAGAIREMRLRGEKASC